MANRETLKSALAAGPDCLPLEQLEALAAQANLHPHLEQCPRCQAELALLKSFESSVPLADEGAAVAWISSQMERRLEQIKGRNRAGSGAVGLGRPTPWLDRLFGTRPARLWVPVGALAVLAVVGVLWLRAPQEPGLQATVQSDHPIYRSQEVEVVSPAGTLAEAPAQLQWRAFEQAALYKATIMEVDHAPIWSLETTREIAPVPASVRDKMLPGKTLLWQVTALDSQGRAIATSQVQRFIVVLRSSGSPN